MTHETIQSEIAFDLSETTNDECDSEIDFDLSIEEIVEEPVYFTRPGRISILDIAL